MKDKLSVLWRTSNTPMWPILAICAGFGTYLGAVFTYPFAVTARQMVDLWPKKNGVDIWQGNYRKAASWLWFACPSWNIAFPGFFKNYFWHVAPMYKNLYLGGS
jgi:solute carrier family 25 (mitochondrial oxoglutarate transporter), member 11